MNTYKVLLTRTITTVEHFSIQADTPEEAVEIAKFGSNQPYDIDELENLVTSDEVELM